jgi:DNA polymerase-3 subunit alpha
MYYKFDCGCKFKQFGEEVKDCDGLPSIEIDYYNLPDCQDAWSDFGTGRTKGVFQLEKSLGRHWCKEVNPMSLEEIAALVSILRPGCLEAFIGDKNLTQHYADRKAGKEIAEPLHPALEQILSDTHQIIVFQEQILLIAQKIAGFTGAQSDTLRKGIGHKDPEIINQIGKEFVDGCEKTGVVTREEGHDIFEKIRANARYGFNKSHAVAYGALSYWTMYAKHHFPLHFYAAYLAHSKDKQDSKQEVKEILDDAKYNCIEVEPPHISSLKNNPYGSVVLENNKILFGLIDIKGVGRKHIENIYNVIKTKEEKLGDIKNWSWVDFMFNMESNSKVLNNLILVGATPGGEPRKQKALEYSIFQKLTGRELEWFTNNYHQYGSLKDSIAKYITVERKDGGPATSKRKEVLNDNLKKLTNSPYSTKDHPDWIVANERELIGVPITYNPVDNKMIATTMNCEDFLNGKRGKIELLVEISTFRESMVKNGPNAGLPMGFVELKDSTGTISGVLFSESFKENQEFLFEGNTVLVYGFRSDKDKNSLVVNKVVQV